MFTQLAIAKGVPWYVNFFRQFDHLFTFGANIGTPHCDVPTGEFTWWKTWQPIVTELWHTDAPATRDRFTTVMTWRTESFTDVDGNKDREFLRFLNLPQQTPSRFALAVNGPQQLLAQHGWAPLQAMRVSNTAASYREFIQSSKAEFGVAKHAYVSRRSGWFSDRTECYLAAGRPALVQDTGWSEHVPAGTGLLAFSTPEEAIDGLARLEAEYSVHARRASEVSTGALRCHPRATAATRKGRSMTDAGKDDGRNWNPSAYCPSWTGSSVDSAPALWIGRNRHRHVGRWSRQSWT